MVMDQFVTTYRKDYLWPYVRSLGIRPHLECLREPCRCLDKSGVARPAYQVDTSGHLLGPKAELVKAPDAPTPTMGRFNQPNVFLQKLQEKYPFIYECLRTAPPDDILARVHRDRLRTTYQVDYSKLGESAPYDQLVRSAGFDGLPPCPEPVRLPADDCKIHRKARISSAKPCRTSYKSKEAEYYAGTTKGGLSSVTVGATEYQDAISRLGYLIIRDRIHDPRRRP
ncbi:uncharacterized protein LOC132705151 [Cylas formicarius]|uniref:uncharacterized protein LOC132705151 n=1 Tax=Cylas formicarius TaxID=197179 RepID=UPI0029587CC9|nr:uncharacterized protein LOC132705151 [Cylas formicarius]